MNGKKNVALSNVGHLMFFSAFFVLNNPFIAMEKNIKFPLFLAALVVGAVIIVLVEEVKSNSRLIRGWIVSFLLCVAALRINFVGSSEGTDGQSQAYQAILTIISLISSVAISNKFDIRKAKTIIFVESLASSLLILANIDNIFDFYSADSFTLGSLNYNSYQTVTQIIGMMAICAASFLTEGKADYRIVIPAIVLIALALYGITESPARGESIGLLVALAAMFISSKRWPVVLLVLAIAAPFADVMSDSRLIGRLTDVSNGDLGERDYLFGLALRQLIDEPKGLFFGGGLNYFQIYNNLQLELYPHNFILEAATSGGIFLAAAFVFCFISPIVRSVFNRTTRSDDNFRLSFMIYLAIIFMKSGTLLSMWGMTMFTCFFIRGNNQEIPPPGHNPGDGVGADGATSLGRIDAGSPALSVVSR